MPGQILEIGAGENPVIGPEAGDTLDIREDLDHIDFPGVDIATEEWPVEANAYGHIIMRNVLEHIDGANLTHVFNELDRVLQSGGTVEIDTPHAGTYAAATDPTHRGVGGTTADFSEYFGGRHEGYFEYLEWNVDSWAEIEFPVFAPDFLTASKRVESGLLSMQFVKLPLVTASVQIRIEKNGE